MNNNEGSNALPSLDEGRASGGGLIASLVLLIVGIVMGSAMGVFVLSPIIYGGIEDNPAIQKAQHLKTTNAPPLRKMQDGTATYSSPVEQQKQGPQQTQIQSMQSVKTDNNIPIIATNRIDDVDENENSSSTQSMQPLLGKDTFEAPLADTGAARASHAKLSNPSQVIEHTANPQKENKSDVENDKTKTNKTYADLLFEKYIHQK